LLPINGMSDWLPKPQEPANARRQRGRAKTRCPSKAALRGLGPFRERRIAHCHELRCGRMALNRVERPKRVIECVGMNAFLEPVPQAPLILDAHIALFGLQHPSGRGFA
jgi:hypothetical protein